MIYLIIGPGGSGKTTLFKNITEKYKYIQPVVLYTTRPMRNEEVDGKDYHFVDKEFLESALADDRILEHRTYSTVHGDWNYFMLKEDLDVYKDYILCTTPDAAIKIAEYYGSTHIKIFYVKVSDNILFKRMLSRTETNVHPDYKELCRRYLADLHDFSFEESEDLQYLDEHFDVHMLYNIDSIEDTLSQFEQLI